VVITRSVAATTRLIGEMSIFKDTRLMPVDAILDLLETRGQKSSHVDSRMHAASQPTGRRGSQEKGVSAKARSREPISCEESQNLMVLA
jgi:hypothetical protein